MQSPARWYSKFLHSRSYGLYLIVFSLPFLFLLFSFHSRTSQERSYPYPPQVTPIITKLREEIALVSGEPFRGRVATFTGQLLQGRISWFDLHAIDSEVLNRFGNDHRTVGLWYYDIPTLFEYNQFITPAFYLVARTFLTRDGDHQMRNVMALREIEPKILRAMGVRFILTDAPVEISAQLRLRLDRNGPSGLLLYELNNANVGDFSPTESLQVPDAREALSVMMRQDFDAARIVIVERPLPSKLVPVLSSRVFVEPGRLRISARSQGTSIVVLPLEYSHCLDLQSISSEAPAARLFRANLLQAGILFSKELEATLTFFTGPFHNAGCRLEDAREIDRLGFKQTLLSFSVPTRTAHSS